MNNQFEEVWAKMKSKAPENVVFVKKGDVEIMQTTEGELKAVSCPASFFQEMMRKKQ